MGLFDNLTPEARLMMGAGIMGGQNLGQGLMNGAQMAMPMMLANKQDTEAKAVENKTRQWLQSQYPGEDFSTMTPDMVKMYAQEAFKSRFSKPDLPALAQEYNFAKENGFTGSFMDYQQAKTSGANPVRPTDDQREYEMAKEQGFKGTFMDYQIKMKEAGRQQVNIDTGEKLPSGYRWKDPNNRDLGVDPIPGGPATQIPAELAARIGMAETFKKRLPDIKKKVMAGDATGPADVFSGQTMGTNAVYADIQSGVDALQRLLTGAGMNVAEAEQYARRYMPGYWDTPETTIKKLDRLTEELDAASQKAMLGRGGDQTSQPAQDNTGAVDYKEFFK